MKKTKLLLILIFVVIALAFLNTEIYAANTMSLNITGVRPYTSTEYKVHTPNSNIHTVFKIIKRDDSATGKIISRNDATYTYDNALYCLRSGLGFGSSQFISDINELGDVLYTERYNLKADATVVQSQLTNMQPDRYNSILWIIDNMYLPEHKDSESMKEALLRKAGIVYGESEEEEKLTDDDIEFVQQMALWYFTNYDENGQDNSLSLAREAVLSNATKVNDHELSERKQILITMLYNYFIEGATEHASDYTASKDILPVKPEVKVDSSSKIVKNELLYSIIGPFKITETEGNVDYNLTVKVTDKNGKIIPETKENQVIIYVVKNPDDTVPACDSIADTVGKGEFYLKLSNRYSTEYDLTDMNIETECKYDKYYKTTATLWLTGNNTDQPVVKVEKEEIREFDLALRKYITKLNGVEIANSKVPNIDKTLLETETTAGYAHRKNPLEVKTGNKVTYKISVYNEGGVKGAVTKIIDYLPVGLDFDVADNTNFIEYRDDYTEADLEGKDYYYSFDTATRALTIWSVTDEKLFELEAFDGETLDEKFIEVVCTVTETTETEDKILTNIATMEYHATEAGYEDVADRDSSSSPSNLNLPTNTNDWENYKGNKNNKAYLADSDYFYKGQEDDDDFDKLIIKGVPFDLALRKFITKINGEEVTSREPQIDTSKINKEDETTGETITTATYTHSKEPVIVKQGDIVTYKIRVYNEGELNGYATKIADYIPEGLGYLIGYKANTENLWVPVADGQTKTIDLVGTEGLYQSETTVKNLKVDDFDSISSLNEVKILTGKAKISTEALEDELIKAYNPELKEEDISDEDNWQQSTNGTDGLYYKEVEITCIVLAKNTYTESIRNIAEIEEDKAVDSEGNEINANDRDSTPNDVDKDNYNPPADNSSYQQDDDDYELIELKYFDLALRKFITQVNDEEVETRIPQVKVDENGQIKYEHDKTPVYVANSDIVTYTIRVYNEGTVLGYAMEIADDIPDGLVFLPEYQTNKDYEWKMYNADGEETTNVEEAVEIRTKYLRNSLLNPYDPTKEINDDNPDFSEVKVAFQVIEENITQEDRILINKAQITEDKAVDEDGDEIDIDDEDSIPDEWNEGEDDQDIEKVYVKKFDLSLLKWVTQTIVTVDGKTTTTDTGFTPYDDPEPIAKVVIDKKKLNRTTVKFVYNIMITNEGEIEGYATEITDYIPAGLEFVAEDNPLWEKAGDNKITTRMLEEKLLKPGESATIQVVFRWKQDADNLGVKTNIAEISEDYNDKGSEDVDSTPDNVEPEDYDKPQEDDDDKAIVMLEIKTGGHTSYIWLGLVVLLIIAGGIVLIQKYVL